MTSPSFALAASVFFVTTLVHVSAQAAFHVLIDPGHGGVDTGAVRGHLKEADIALKVAQRLAAKLKDDPRFVVSLTRQGNETVSLTRRTEIAEETKADLFLSIHLNSSTDPRAHGKEFYFQNQMPADEESFFLASRENSASDAGQDGVEDDREPTIDTARLNSANSGSIGGPGKREKLSAKTDLKRILEDLGRNHRIRSSSELSQIFLTAWPTENDGQKVGTRAIRQAPFQVVSRVKIPSVLVELGFISNAQEGPRLAQSAYQEQLAESLVTGLIKYKETVDKDREPKLSLAE